MSKRENHGGEDDLAPVIPLFGTPSASVPKRGDATPQSRDAEDDASVTEPVVSTGNSWVVEDNPVASTDQDGWFVDSDATTGEEWPSFEAGSESEHDAPFEGNEPAHRDGVADVRPLSSARSVRGRGDEEGSRRRHPSVSPTLVRASELAKPEGERKAEPVPGHQSPVDYRAGATKRSPRTAPRLRVIESEDDEAQAPNPAEQREQAEKALLKKLRGRGMSLSEARTYLRGLGYDESIQNELVDLFVARGYLDDAVLAEQIVYAGSTRKGQGRRAISMALSARGIDREIIEAALAELEDDDAERALEFARTRANSLARLAPDVALRRLIGQLSRRGFGGSVARDAATTALREVSGGPRFR